MSTTWFGFFIASIVLLCLLAAVAIIVVNLYRTVRDAIPRENDEL